MNVSENFFSRLEEPNRSCLLALKQIILAHDSRLDTAIKYGMPFFMLFRKNLCYLWIDKETRQPYIGFVDGQLLDDARMEKGDRSRMSIFRLRSDQDLPVVDIQSLLQKAIRLREKAN